MSKKDALDFLQQPFLFPVADSTVEMTVLQGVEDIEGTYAYVLPGVRITTDCGVSSKHSELRCPCVVRTRSAQCDRRKTPV